MKIKSKKTLICSIMAVIGIFLFAGNVEAKTTLDFECVNNDNTNEKTTFSDYDGSEFIESFMLPNYCFTGTGCSLNFDRSDLGAIGKINFGSGEEYFYLSKGVGVRIYEQGGPHAVDQTTYDSKYNTLEITSSFNEMGKAVIWMGSTDEESRWLTFYSESYLGLDLSNHDKIPFPEMFLTQGMNFTTDNSRELKLFYGMRNLEFEIENGKIVSDVKIKSGDNSVRVAKTGTNYTIGSNNLSVNNKYRFSFNNLYKPTSTVLLEITYLKDYHTFDTALAVNNQTLVNTEKVDKTLTFTKSAFNNDFLEFINQFKVRYIAKAEFYYCISIPVGSTSCTKGDFDPYLQLVYYKNNKVIGTQQVRVHDFAILDDQNPSSSVKMDDLITLDVAKNYQIPITVEVANNENVAVRDADKIAYYLTDGMIEASSETMPKLSFGIGAGLQIEKRVD